MPRYLEPMKATLATKPFRDEDWLFEVKWDGYRVEAVVRDGKVSLFTRNGHDAETYFPRLLTPPTWIDAREAIVDGEVVALDAAGRPDFGAAPGAARRRGGRTAGAARVPGVRPAPPRRALAAGRARSSSASGSSSWSSGRRPRPGGAGNRRPRASRSSRRPGPRVSRGSSPSTAGPATSPAGAPRPGSRSRPARSRSWSSAAGRRGRGRAKELGALVVGVYDGERLRFAGKVGSGFDGADAQGPAGAPRGARDRRARLRPRAAAGLQGPLGRRPRRRALDPAGAGHPGGDSAAGLATGTSASPPTRGWSPAAIRGRSCASAPSTRRRPSARPGRSPIGGDRGTAMTPAPAVSDDRRWPSLDPAWLVSDAELDALGRLKADGTWHVAGQDLGSRTSTRSSSRRATAWTRLP